MVRYSDTRKAARCCHLLVLPCTPDPLGLEALMLTISALKNLGSERFWILLTIVPPTERFGGWSLFSGQC